MIEHREDWPRQSQSAVHAQSHDCRDRIPCYSIAVNHLTKQELLVLSVIVGLLLTGWAVKTYRIAHPTSTPLHTAKP